MLADLRYGRFWLVFGWVSVAAAMVLSLMPGSDLPKWNDKLEHALGYFLLTFWFCGIYARRHHWLVGLAMLGMGALVEILQGIMHMGRQADVHDLVADIIGIAPALLLALTPLSHWPRWIEALIKRT
ncbi:MAG: VanZ family protein [Steroidobacteraceae bacterium]